MMAMRELTVDERDTCDRLFQAWFETQVRGMTYKETWNKMYRAWSAMFRLWATAQGNCPLPAYENFRLAMQELTGMSMEGRL